MAQAFSVKNYFKKLHSAELLTEFYGKHEIQAFFEITDSTARKNVIAIFNDFYTSLPPEQKIDIQKELSLIHSISTPYATDLFLSLLKENKIPNAETRVETSTDHDRTLYYFLYHKDLFDQVLFLHSFYIKPNYMIYEAKEVDLVEADLAITELGREFKRIANKEDRVTECYIESKMLDDFLYINATFEGEPVLQMKKDSLTGDIEQSTASKKIEVVRIVYLPKDKEVLISFTGSKYEKLIFLDTFLRVVCKSGYEEKIEQFDLTSFKDQTFDFGKSNKGLPLMSWKIKGVTFTLGQSEKTKKKIRLTLPSTQQENALLPLFSTLDEIGVTETFKNYSVENVALSFSFTDKMKSDKVVSVQTSISLTKSSLCPLFFYHRYARALLKQAGIDKGFIEAAKKEKEDVAKKWEV